jgi:RNA polymerase sigma-70 factor (ECF subfamily)
MHVYSSLSDQQLSDLLRNGDKAAYTEVYERYFDPLYVHAVRKLGNVDDAKDLVQELFATLWHKHIELETASLAAYLFTSVRNRVLDIYSRQKVANKYIASFQDYLSSSHDSTEHLVREKQLTALIEKEIQALPDKMREIFELSRKANLSHREIAERLQISEQTVAKQVTNALKTLRVKLGVFVFIMMIIG